MQLNFNNQKNNLTEQDIDEIVALVCHRCRIDTYNKVRNILTKVPSTVPFFGILERLIKEDGKWTYCVGQSYTDEIKVVRECIIKRK